MKNIVYSLDHLLKLEDETGDKFRSLKKLGDLKRSIRHTVINTFDDFCDKDKSFLLALKNEIFDGNNIYVSGSRITGKYITKKEYLKYKDEYIGLKPSDWDIQSMFVPNMDKLKQFAIEHDVKIDFSKGINKVKI